MTQGGRSPIRQPRRSVYRMCRAAAAVAVAALGVTAPASAQVLPGCADEGSIATRVAVAPVAFIGTVAALSDKGRVATVDVLKVWKGGPLPRRVEVRGTIATQSKVVTALDRLYASHRTYLFVPSAGVTPHFVENQCSATRAISSEVTALGPADGGQQPTSASGVSLPGNGLAKLAPLAIGAAGFLLIGAFLTRQILRDRRRRAQPASA